MNKEGQDIIRIIAAHPGIVTSDIPDKMEQLGYYSNMASSGAITERISKACCDLRNRGYLTSERLTTITGGYENSWRVTPAATTNGYEPEQEPATQTADEVVDSLLDQAKTQLALKEETEDKTECCGKCQAESVDEAELIDDESIKLTPLAIDIKFNNSALSIVFVDGEIHGFSDFHSIKEPDFTFKSAAQVRNFADALISLFPKG